MKRVICSAMVLGLLAGCSSMRVAIGYSEATDFTALRTFQFKETDHSFAGIDQAVHQRIVDAITQEMTTQGFTKVDSNPDVYISYYGKVSEQLVLMTRDMGYGWSSSWRWGTTRIGTTTASVSTYERGTLVIDMWEAGAKELIWRGTVADILSKNPDRNNDRINRGIARMFENFPHSTG